MSYGGSTGGGRGGSGSPGRGGSRSPGGGRLSDAELMELLDELLELLDELEDSSLAVPPGESGVTNPIIPNRPTAPSILTNSQPMPLTEVSMSSAEFQFPQSQN